MIRFILIFPIALFIALAGFYGFSQILPILDQNKKAPLTDLSLPKAPALKKVPVSTLATELKSYSTQHLDPLIIKNRPAIELKSIRNPHIFGDRFWNPLQNLSPLASPSPPNKTEQPSTKNDAIVQSLLHQYTNRKDGL